MTVGLERVFGHVFADRGLLAQALTHSSYSEANYERLEFLGDRVLGLVVGNWLWQRHPEALEGELSRRYSAMVRESTLVEVARGWGFEPLVQVGPGEVLKDSILADVVEALLGVLWLEGGLPAVETVIKRDWAAYVDLKDEKDPKGRLQEWLQGRKLSLPTYEVLEERGPDHDKYFQVLVKTAAGNATGEGRSKQAAGAEAAANLMNILEK